MCGNSVSQPIFFMRVLTSLKSRRGSRGHNRMKPERETSFHSFISMLCLQQNSEKNRHQSFQKERSTKRSNMLFLDPQFSWDPARSEYVNIFWKTEIFAYNLRMTGGNKCKMYSSMPKTQQSFFSIATNTKAVPMCHFMPLTIEQRTC